MVTGKNKEQFEEWYDEFTTYGTIITFRGLPFEMQLGVYLAYYDSKGVEIEVVKIRGNQPCRLYVVWSVNNETGYKNTGFKETLEEAYNEGLKEANKFMNVPNN